MPVLTYLSFGGNCREALDFYRSVFGGEYVRIQTFGDGPPDMGVPDSDRGKIMHATLTVGDGVIMGSDMPSNFGPPPVVGNNFSLTLPHAEQGGDRRAVRQDVGGRHGDRCRSKRCSGAPTSAPARTGSASTGSSTTR